MPATPLRLLLGFGAGVLSHIVFQGALSVILFAAGVIPAVSWSLAPLPPFGVPRTINLAFWAGLWGIAYASVEPRLVPRAGIVKAGVAFGVAAMLVRWFIVLPLKGAGIAEGLDPKMMLVYAAFHQAFGLGLALIYSVAMGFTRRESPSPARARPN